MPSFPHVAGPRRSYSCVRVSPLYHSQAISCANKLTHGQRGVSLLLAFILAGKASNWALFSLLHPPLFALTDSEGSQDFRGGQ